LSIGLTSIVSDTATIPGSLGAIPWPTTGQSAIALSGVGVMARTASQKEVPIASLTKMMTALVVLDDHPLSPGQAGPSFVMSQADVAAFIQADESDESNVAVKAGEVLTYYQLLEALLIPSADNIANILAVWDAGSMASFVAKMNATAAVIGLHHTHYADASGVNPDSKSTAGDQAVVAAALMSLPIVQSIVDRQSAPFPVAGTIWNPNRALGTDGIIGVKSGYTSEANGCLAVAAWHTVAKMSALVVAVTLSQPGGLYGAAEGDERLITKAQASVVSYQPIAPGTAVASVEVPWSTKTLSAGVVDNATFFGWPGLVIHELVVAAPATKATVASGDVGTVEFIALGKTIGEVSLDATTPLPAMPAGWSSAAS
jgi:D-alanyl-D-alanine carboxypeptidase (penicillin-binding protein 5/6)